MSKIWNILSSIVIIALFVWFIKWFVKGLFDPKWFWAYWIWLIVSITIGYRDYNKHKNFQYDHRTGSEIWEEQYGKQ